MDIGNIKKYADLAFSVAQSKRNALENLRSRQLIAYNECLFRADAQTINLVKALKDMSDNFVVLDVNDNPCEIKNPKEFLEKLIERNQETLNAYNQLHKDFANKRLK
tara:strand:+ start:216 stop:536 length:321 start_codon:yes stop_codon:yes gene_type:complete